MPKLPSRILLILAAACTAAVAQGAGTQPSGERRRERAPLVFLDSTRERDGLRGPVRRVETEIVTVVREGERVREKSHALLERTLYDEAGRRAENETYPVVGRRAGVETHRYDAQGNLAETVVRDARGTLLSRTRYDYEFDRFGNWTRMTASVAVSNAGRVGYEPTEITRRAITYYAVEDADARDGTPGKRLRANDDVARATPVAADAKPARERPAAKATQGATPASAAAAAGPTMFVGVLNGRSKELPRPAYPVGAMPLEKPITVAVEVVIDITGRVESARARGGAAELRAAAESAARRALFMPFYAAGRPVRAHGTINYTFEFMP